MSGTYRHSELPKQIDLLTSAVPVFTSAGDPAMLAISGTYVDLSRITFTNSTGSTISVTMTNASGLVLNNVSNFQVPAGGTTETLDFNTPLRAVGGLRIWAPSAGCHFSLRAWGHPNFKAQ